MPDPVVTPSVTPAVITPPAVTPPAVTPPPADPATLLSGGDEPPALGTPPQVTPADWPQDWRDKMAGGNDKVLNVIKRFSSPQAIANALLSDRRLMSEGKLKPALTADATPEQIAEYRKANAIPDKPDGYLEKLPDGLVIGEDDKPYVTKFAEAMHAKNASPDMVHSALRAYYDIQSQQTAALQDANESARVEGQEALMAEWGSDFRANRNAVINLLKTVPEDTRNVLGTARDSDGILIFNRADVLKAFSDLARANNMVGTVVPPDGDIAKAVNDELASIKTTLMTKPEVYWARTPEGERMRQRYGELLEAKDKIGNKAA